MTLTFPLTSAGPGPTSAALKFYIFSAEIAIPLRLMLIPVFHPGFPVHINFLILYCQPHIVIFPHRKHYQLFQHCKPLWNLSSKNRVAPVSIQDGVQHGITFAAISTIPAAPSPISAELSPIPATLSRSLRRLAAAPSPIVARLAKHNKTLLNIVKHCNTPQNIVNQK